MLLSALLPLFNLILSERRDEKIKINITTIKVTQQLVASQLNMVVKSHITAAINCKSKASEGTGSSIGKD